MAWIEKRKIKGGIAYYVIDRVNGKRVSEAAGPSHMVARELKSKIETQAYKGQHGILNKDITIGEAAEKYLKFCADNHKEKSAKGKRSHINKLLAFFGAEQKLSSITSEAFLDMRDKYLSGHCKNGTVTVIKQILPFFSYCIERKMMTESPGEFALKKFKYNKVARFLSEEEVVALRETIKTNRSGGDGLLDLFDIALLTGMRKGELIGLKKSYVQGEVIVLPTAKNDDPRVIPIHVMIRPLLEKYMTKENMFEEWSEDRINLAWTRTKAKAIKAERISGRIRWHDLRHTFASNYLKTGGTLADLRLILGHRSLVTLQIYAHFQASDLQKKIQNMSANFMKTKFEAA